MAITAADVAKLRKTTGAGMMDCKKALTETNGDFEAAIDFLRKRGQKISAKRADREATEGVVVAVTNDAHNFGVVVELNCETDFVAKNADFVQVAKNIAEAAVSNNIKSKDDLLNMELNGTRISELIVDQVAKIGEKIEISNFAILEAEAVVPYIHMGNSIGVLVGLNIAGDDVNTIGKDVAMQIAAMNPIAVDKSRVSEDVIEHERAIAMEQIKAEGKPEHIAGKIAEGKLNKFFKENTLMAQQFVKDSSKNISEVLQEVNKELTVKDFVRIAIGG